MGSTWGPLRFFNGDWGGFLFRTLREASMRFCLIIWLRLMHIQTSKRYLLSVVFDFKRSRNYIQNRTDFFSVLILIERICRVGKPRQSQLYTIFYCLKTETGTDLKKILHRPTVVEMRGAS
jgi:hypothetical protein